MKNKVKNPYIHSLLQPVETKPTDRKVWSIPLGGVWLPFFTATNTAGETAIAHEALGAPLRLQREKDGTPKFSQSGRPVVRVAKEISDQVRIARENFVVGLLNYAEGVAKAMPAEYQAEVNANLKAGKPISDKDMNDLTEYVNAQSEPVAEAEADAILDKAKAEAAAKYPPAEVEAVMAEAEAKELVPA